MKSAAFSSCPWGERELCGCTVKKLQKKTLNVCISQQKTLTLPSLSWKQSFYLKEGLIPIEVEAVACEGHRFCFFFSFFFCFHLFLFVFSSLSFSLLASSLCFLPFVFFPLFSSLCFLSIVLSPRQSYAAPSFIIGIAMECFRCCQGSTGYSGIRRKGKARGRIRTPKDGLRPLT